MNPGVLSLISGAFGLSLPPSSLNLQITKGLRLLLWIEVPR